MKIRKKWLGITLTGVLLSNTLVPFAKLPSVHAEAASHVVISEVYGGGGNSGANYKNDFIELYNPTDTAVDLTGWSVQYDSATGTGTGYYQVTNLVNSIKPHGYYLVQQGKGTGGTADLPTPDQTGNINMAGGAGKVALVNSTTALPKTSKSNDASIIDFVGFGPTANAFEGTAPTVPPTNTESVVRKANDGSDPALDGSKGNGWDTNDNAGDFLKAVPNPLNSANQSSTPSEPGEQLPPLTGTAKISAVREMDATGKPKRIGQTATIEAVVTVDDKIVDSKNSSFYVQDDTGGINVFGSTTPDIVKGDKLKITGTIDFYNGLTELKPTLIEKIGTEEVPASTAMTIIDLNDGSKAELQEGKLIAVKGKVTNIPAAPDTSGGTNVTVTDETGKTVTVRLLPNTGITAVTDIKLNSSYEFTGLLSQYKSTAPYLSGYQILPRSKGDLKEFFPLSISHTPVTKVYTNADFTFTADVQGADSVTFYYKKSDAADYQTISMTDKGNHQYTAVLASDQMPAGSFVYYIEAKNQTETKKTETQTVSVVDDKEGPAFIGESPANGSIVENYKPAISVKWNDPSEVDATKGKVFLDSEDVTAQAVIDDKQVLLSLSNDLQVGTHTVKVTGSDKLGNPSEYTWSFTVKAPFTGGNHLRGTTHNHTNISHDGTGSPEDALKAAIAHGYDWFAFSDHSHDIDPEKLGSDTVDHKGKPERTGGTEWQLTKDLAKQYSNDNFTVFPAFEMTSTTWGHSNVFGTDNFIDRNLNNKMYQDLNSYYAWVLTYDDIAAQFNHPDMSANAFNNFMPYDKNVDRLFTMLEVGNGSGNYGYANAEKKFYSALDLGWHVAPTFGEDNHDGTWGQTMKRTVIVTDNNAQASLLHAMKNRRVYMEEDPNFTLDMLANGKYMGSVVDGNTISFDIKGSDNVAEARSVKGFEYLPASYQSNDNIEKVELLTNGAKVVDSITPDGKEFTWKPEVTVNGGQQWFVVKVTQKDGERIYSAPIWSQEKEVDVRVSGLNVKDGVAIAGNPATLSAGISNLGTKDLSNLNVKFYYDLEDDTHLIGTKSIAAIPAKGVQEASVTWQSPIVGDHKMIAVVDTPDGDDPADNKETLDLKVKESLGKTILIDAAHKNENTTTDTGTYKDNFKAFTKMVQKEGYTVAENKTPLTAESLANISVLVITHPFVALTAEEKTAVGDYVKAGGSLFLTDKSNYKNDPAINNDMLAQMGATIQINSDQINDDSKDGNFWTNQTSKFAVRLHPGLVKNNLTDRVSTVEYYSGTSLEKVGHLPLTDSETVTIVTKGNETTYQTTVTTGFNVYDTVSDSTGGSAIPAIAAETVGQGRIVVSGMNFVNDKQMDESFSPKGNDELGMNIMNWLAKREINQVISINDARKLTDGTPTVVEGTVTTAAGSFYDAFYIEDETGGIMAFNEVPDGSLKLGDKVRIYGHIKTFENNKELEFDKFATDVIKIGETAPVEPKSISTNDASSEENQGLLVKVKGRVVSKFDENSYIVNDGSGDILVFTDGYIVNQTGPVPALNSGDLIEAVGLTGKYAGGNRIRVRDTKELKGTADSVKPVTEAATTPDIAGNPFTEPVTVTLTATDDNSGVKSTQYRINEQEWIDYTAPYTLSDAGSYKIEYRSTDFAGNVEDNKSLEFEVKSPVIPDTTAPVTTLKTLPELTDKPFTGPVTITLSAEDENSGVKSTQYRINEQEWIDYTAPFTVSDIGSYKIEYRSSDLANNIEDSKVLEFEIKSPVIPDTTAPTTTVKLTPAQTDKPFTKPVTVTLTAQDDKSGVKTTEYRVNGQAWSTYNAPYTVNKSDIYKIEYRSTDQAGNIEATKTIQFTIDMDAPVTSAKTTPVSEGNIFAKPVTISLSAKDILSGVKSTQYRIDGKEWKTYSTPFKLESGKFTIEYRSTDKAGNVESTKSISVIVDTEAPVTTSKTTPEKSGNIFNQIVTVKLSATDKLSGVKLTQYRIDGKEWKTYTASFTLKAAGKYKVEYRSTDKAGNVESTKSLVLTIDTKAAETTAKLSPVKKDNIYTEPVSITLTAKDDLSGVKSIQYSINGQSWKTYSAAFKVKEIGEYKIEYRSTDKAGNIEKTKSLKLTIKESEEARKAREKKEQEALQKKASKAQSDLDEKLKNEKDAKKALEQINKDASAIKPDKNGKVSQDKVAIVLGQYQAVINELNKAKKSQDSFNTVTETYVRLYTNLSKDNVCRESLLDLVKFNIKTSKQMDEMIKKVKEKKVDVIELQKISDEMKKKEKEKAKKK
ncbi:OmpL47-type beta-barrel domain-containing protein [Fictibacillus barbaricus]|uniref:Histidinol phosphatase-like PHP family hydrolase/uncharacterized protein YdeI (BOF family) n=1 Tax=Fictibacillus barbaricus TaxID=182136 RepID=A0ABU1U1D3_9BACL|nr:CehA/McbA family metallohydrolase [Fictibacillus barbaricus]MDR7073221.1 histidinol phosphatase-like PHP family hydrolase/uncharacterized protein YdeI (BOF family) [Fictibacillus barbaricus]